MQGGRSVFPVAPSTSTSARPPFVGRREEFAFCQAVIAKEHATGLIVIGAAGVGKSRLATEVLDAAESLQYVTQRVIATESGHALPLGAFAPLIPIEGDGAASSLELLRLTRLAITQRGGDRPILLFVDDAHLLDPTSAMLVQQLAANNEATIIATVRAGEPAPDAVVALWKDHGCEYLELQPLSLDETGELVESLVNGDVDGHTRHRLWTASRGLPLVVRELVLGGLERQLLSPHNGLWRWRGPLRAPGRLLELIETRIGSLDDGQRELLELVTLGEPFGWSMLRAREVPMAEGLVRRAVLTVARDGRRLDLRLAHPLFGESIRAGMSATRAASVYARLAGALEESGLRRRGDLLRFGICCTGAGTAGSPDLLVRAAEAARWAPDLALAERLARLALDLGGGPLEQLALARVLTDQERFVEADEILKPLVGEADSDEVRALAASARARNLVGSGGGAEAEDVVVKAQARVVDASLRRELEFVRCWILYEAGRTAEAANASLALADDVDAEYDVRVRTATIAAFALHLAGRAEDALSFLARWQPPLEDGSYHASEGIPVSLLRANFREAHFLSLLFAGRLVAAKEAAAEAYDLFVGGLPAESMAFPAGLVALVQGSLNKASRRFREAAEIQRETDPAIASLPWILAFEAQTLAQMGDVVAAKASAAEAEGARRGGAWVYDADLLLAGAWIAAAEGALGSARKSAAAAADLAEKRGALTTCFLAAHDLLRLGAPGPAAERLTGLAGRVQGRLVTACAEHAAAVVSRDGRRVESAAASFAELGALLWAAEAQSTAASLYREAGREASARSAAARAALYLEQCEGARTPALATSAPAEGLTARELEIATLAAAGATNREIAERLVVSVRTVENHLHRAYGKLGIESREDLRRLIESP